MAQIHLQSVESPFGDTPEVLRASLQVLFLSEAMGLIPGSETVEKLDAGSFITFLGWLDTAGIGTWTPTLADRTWKEAPNLLALVSRLGDALEESPHPQTEWVSIALVLDDDRLCRLLGISEASLRRYMTGSRSTPDAVAFRLHFLTKVIADLKGSYNDIGVRNWFDRKRHQLGDRSPAEILSGQWSPSDEEVLEVRSLAANLTALPAT